MKYYRIFAFDVTTESGRHFEDRVQPFLDNNWQPLGISPAILLLQKEVVSEEQFEEIKESFGVDKKNETKYALYTSIDGGQEVFFSAEFSTKEDAEKVAKELVRGNSCWESYRIEEVQE